MIERCVIEAVQGRMSACVGAWASLIGRWVDCYLLADGGEFRSEMDCMIEMGCALDAAAARSRKQCVCMKTTIVKFSLKQDE